MPTSRQPIIVRHKSDSVNVAQHLHDDYKAEKQLADAKHEIYVEKYGEERGIVTTARDKKRLYDKVLPKRGEPPIDDEEDLMMLDEGILTDQPLMINEETMPDQLLLTDGKKNVPIQLGSYVYTRHYDGTVSVSIGDYTFLSHVPYDRTIRLGSSGREVLDSSLDLTVCSHSIHLHQMVNVLQRYNIISLQMKKGRSSSIKQYSIGWHHSRMVHI